MGVSDQVHLIKTLSGDLQRGLVSVDLKLQASPVRTSLHKCSFRGRFARRKPLFSKKNMKVRPQTRTPGVMFFGQMILKMNHLDTRTEDMLEGVIHHSRKM